MFVSLTCTKQTPVYYEHKSKCVSDVMVSVLVSSAVDHRFEPKTIKLMFIAPILSRFPYYSGFSSNRILFYSGFNLNSIPYYSGFG
jgi:hypothetical protein